jgi:hypothetical protein
VEEVGFHLKQEEKVEAHGFGNEIDGVEYNDTTIT